jgi:cation diffusion facilitator CzcD-associated flavoprotein CzcO
MKDHKNPRIIIVGAGFSGIGLAFKLQEAGFTNLKIFERGEGIGGTWWFNTYPGIMVDVPADLYSYSFAPKADWSQQFAPGEEIQNYIEDCANKFDVKKYITFNTEIINSVFNEKNHEWVVTTDAGQNSYAILLFLLLGG